MECLGVELRDLQRGLALFASLSQYFILAAINRLLAHMTDIGDIFDVQYLKATILEVAAYPVGHGKGAQVANVDVPVDGGPHEYILMLPGSIGTISSMLRDRVLYILIMRRVTFHDLTTL